MRSVVDRNVAMLRVPVHTHMQSFTVVTRFGALREPSTEIKNLLQRKKFTKFQVLV